MPIAIKREKAFYNSNCIVDEYASATAIRKMIIKKEQINMYNIMLKLV